MTHLTVYSYLAVCVGRLELPGLGTGWTLYGSARAEEHYNYCC